MAVEEISVRALWVLWQEVGEGLSQVSQGSGEAWQEGDLVGSGGQGSSSGGERAETRGLREVGGLRGLGVRGVLWGFVSTLLEGSTVVVLS